MNYKLNHANIKDWAKNYDGEPFDAILCDPPYELGFMGKSWDSSGIAFDSEMWADLLRILKPGGHLLAFSSSRTYHRMAVAIEDAGFEIRDQLIWMYGSGFPKSLNIGKAVDKIQGNEREVVGTRTDGVGKVNDGGILRVNALSENEVGMQKEYPDTKGKSEWEGYGTALKPAHEPCVLARKPIEGTVANNVLKHGTGGLNIDGTRVGTETMTEGRAKQAGSVAWQGEDRSDGKGSGFKDTPLDNPQIHTGRFPANLIHDGSDEVEAVFPQTGKSAVRKGGKGGSGLYGGSFGDDAVGGFTDSGSASRYFYTAKASKNERNAGLEDTTNGHPTVKPLSLIKYLATLIKPPTGGRILVPFSGSGSEMIGALQAGWDYVEGVELTEEYIPIAEARIKYWLEQKTQEEKQGVLL